MNATQKRALIQVTVTFAGLVSGLVIALIAFAMSGGGDGWNSALGSASSVITAPAAAIAWFVRRSRAGLPVAASVVVVNTGLSLLLLKESSSEGSAYLERVIASIPEYFALWLLLWIGWQLLAVLALVAAIRER